MPYAAPSFIPSFTVAYPTPPPSPLSDQLGLSVGTPAGACTRAATTPTCDKVFWSNTPPISPPISADPYLTAAANLLPPSSRPPLRRSVPSLASSQIDAWSDCDSERAPAASLRLYPPKGILAVLGGVRVLRIEAASVLDRMSYTGHALVVPSMSSLPSSAGGTPTATNAVLVAADNSAHVFAADVAAEAVRIDTGILSLRRAQSESTVQQALTSKTIVPTVGLPTVNESNNSSPSSPRVLSPTTDSTTPPRSPGTTPRSPRPPARLISRHIRMPSSSSSPSTISIIPNVLPEVRSPRRNPNTETLQLQTRRSRRPRLFGFTGLVDESYSAASSAQSSPERPLSPIESTLSSSNMLPRRNPIRVRSDTSLSSLVHVVSPVPISPSTPKRERRDTGLKLDLGIILPPAPTDLPPNAGVVKSPYHSVIKKKSGEIVKPALKYGGPLLANGTPAEKRQNAFHGSRSCPATPSCPKYVHFDTQLERVKLFLQDQKPQVVSRQGSPTDEMSENEADVEDDNDKRILTIRLPDFPTSQDHGAKIFLESLHLNDSRDALRGVVRVKNIAFEKSVTVRFTFDWWQTTSEVTATYKESIRGGLYDRFQFALNLTDLLDRIEEKTLFLCVRYNTGGEEMWDSNGGSNYQVLFEKKKLVIPKYMPKRNATLPSGMGKSVTRSGSPWSVTGADADRMADLRAKLNRLTAEDRDLNKPLSPVKRTFAAAPRSPRPHFIRTGSEGADLPSLAGRYDIGSALKSSRKVSPQMATRDLPESPAAKEFYSPRPGHFSLPGPPSPGAASPGIPESPTAGSNTLSSPPALPSLTSANNSSSTSLDSVADTPADSPSLSLRGLREPEDPTPSDTNSSASSSNVSGASSPRSPTDVFPWSSDAKMRSSDDMSLASYSNFIEQFCWAGGVGRHADGVRRTHSTSSLDHYFSSPPDALTPRAYTPTIALSRSASSNGNGNGNASATAATPSASAVQRRASPPSLADLEHVDNAIRSLSNSLATTPVSSPHVSAPMSRIASTTPPVLAT